MASLVVINLDQRIVDALKQRAARHGRSAEAEHRALLEESGTCLFDPILARERSTPGFICLAHDSP